MKHAYLHVALTLVALFSSPMVRAQQAWRPFRPGLIYSFGTSGNPATYLLRLDSAYTTAAGDSAWAFNRLLRPTDNSVLARYAFSSSRPSRNNLFGARLTWQPGTSEFVLENVAEGSYQAALALRLRPRAAVGSTWAASTAPALMATLTSRSWQPVSGAPGSPFDTVAVITLSSGQALRLSRRYGLLAGPRWLASSGPVPQWELAQLPTTLANSPVSPATLFSFQPGDRLGYAETPRSVGSPPCVTTYTLRIIQTRQQVGDSLLYTYRQQARVITSATFGCFNPGTVVGPVRTGRLAFSLRTGQSPQFRALPLLSGEYRGFNPTNANFGVVVGLGTGPNGAVSCIPLSSALFYQGMRRTSGILYSTVTDGNWYQTFAPKTGVGDMMTDENYLDYFVKARPNGIIICGSPTNFANLLPTRAAQAAALATLHPNPAAEQATLTLAQPARPGHALRLTDMLGRAVWQAAVPVGHTALPVPLAGQPAGLYLLHLNGPNGTTATWKLTHE